MTLGGRPPGGSGKAGRGIGGITKPNATTMRIAFDDGTAPVDVPLPPSTVPGPAPTIVPFAQGTAVVVGNLTQYQNALYPVTTAHTYGAAFDATKHGASVAGPGKSAYDLALAAGTVPAGTTLDQYNRMVIPGFIAVRTDLPKFCIFYWDLTLLAWTLGLPSSHGKTVSTAVAATDQDGNLIRVGNPVRFAGSGLATNALYKVENPTATGAPNLAAYTSIPDAVLSNIGKSFMPVGRILDLGAGPYLDFMQWRPVVPDGAVGSVGMGIPGFTYNVQPTAAQITRLIDAAGGNTDGPWDNKLFADGDANTGSGFTASPVQALVGGTQKGVFLGQLGYGGKHAGYAGAIPALQEFYARMLFQNESNVTSGGIVFGASAAAFTALRTDGGPYNLNLESVAITSASAFTTTQIAGVQGVNVTPALTLKTLVFLELQHKIVNGVSVIKARAYAYDTSKGITPAGLAAQGGNVPAWTVNYTHTAAFPAGRIGYEMTQDHIHLHSLIVSADPDVAPPYAVS